MSGKGIGASVLRTEDKRFLTGSGKYTDDLNLPGQAYAYFLRSPHAHARIKRLDKSAALALPGVTAVLDGRDWAASGHGGLICGWMIYSKNGEEMKQPAHPPLTADKVRFVGDPVAVVIAETLAQAKDGAEGLVVEYEELPAIAAAAEASGKDAPQIHEEAPSNLCYDWEIGDKKATEAAFKKADQVVEIDVVNNRLVANPIEPRAAIGDYDAATDAMTLYTTSQNPHLARLVLSAFVGLAPEHKLRIVAPDVGGGFGCKIFIYPEETVCAWAAKKIGRAVKWTADRSESFLADAHGRDHVSHAALALDKDGKFLGLRVKTTANLGAYLSTFASAVPTYLYATLLAGQYTTPAIYAEVDGMFTNTAPVDAYRGAGRPEATYLLERLVEKAARRLNIDPAELRRRNFVPNDAFPYETPVGMTYDSGNYEANLARALELIDRDGFAARRAAAESNGQLRGIGMAAYIEACGMAPSQVAASLGAGVGLYESAEIRMHPTGSATVFTGTHSHGQSHETTFAQVVSEKLGIPFENIEVIHGDTAQVQFGMGTYGSRSIAVGGSAIVKAADKIIAKCRKIAAHTLDATAEELEYENGTFTVPGTNRNMTIPEAAFAAYVPHNYPLDELEPGLDETAFYDPANFTFPAGTHICEVEVDPETGVVKIVKFVAVDDFGTLINPMIVEGQVHGGVAQGIGQALLESCVYDSASGQLLSGSFMDYALPRADDLPSYTVDVTETPCPHNPLGVKGCGEAGAIGAPPAVINAITDAIGADIEMPASPERVWRAIQGARQAAQ